MSIYDELLGAQQQTGKYDALIDEDEQRRKGVLSTSLNLGAKHNPDKSAQVINLSQRLSLPSDTVERNFEQVQRLAGAPNYDKMLSDTPRLARWLSEPENAQIAHDDLQSLGTLEWMFKAPGAALKQGLAPIELGDLGMRAMAQDGRLSDAEEARITELQTLAGADIGAEGFWSKAYTGAFKTAPQIGTSLLRGTKMGLGGAIAAGSAAAIGGQAGPQVLAPEELITVPVAAGAGFTIGSTVGAFEAARDMEAGNAYLEFRAIKDVDGKPIDPEIARIAAQAAGHASALVELAGLGVLVKSFPGGSKLLSGLTREGIRDVLGRPTVTAALGALGKRFAGVWTAETAQEVTQEAVTILAGELAKGAAGAEGATTGEVVERLGQAAVSAAQEFAIISALGPGASFISDTTRVRRATENQKVFEALASGDSKLRQRLPEKFRDFVAKATAGGPAETVYIPADKFVEYFQSADIDPAEIAGKIPAIAEQLDAALASGGDLAIPMADFAAYLAPSEHYAGLSQDLRLKPDDMTAREAKEWENQAEALSKELKAETPVSRETAEPVYQDVLGQLLASGMERGTAEKNATLMQSVFQSLGERSGQDPAELYRQYGLTVRRELPPGLKKAAEIDTTLDPLIDRLRRGDVPKAAARGPTLAAFLRKRGGLKDDGGELSGRDVNKSLRGLVRPEGMSLDHAAEAAVEAGYITEHTEQALLDAVDAEISGRPVYAEAAQGDLDLRALAELDDFLSQADVDLSAMDNEAIKVLLRQAAASEAPGFEQPAFHGSPHDFDAFRLEKIGTGEGAQAYGWGLYFAEEKEIAGIYQHGLSDWMPRGVKVEPGSAADRAAAYMADAFDRSNTTTPYRFAVNLARAEKAPAAVIDTLQKWEAAGVEFGRGNLYTVDIPDAAVAKMLDWDKSMPDQSDSVKVALDSLDVPMFKAWKQSGAWDHVSGQTVYKHLADGLTVGSVQQGKSREASEALRAAGIPGLKYKDEGSRGKSEGTRNLVVFDDKIITITHKNGEPFTPAEKREALEEMHDSTETLFQSASSQTDTPAFKNWFGDSKVVDENGEPLVVYHGTTEDFDAFSKGMVGARTGNKYRGPAFFFTTNKPTASAYATTNASHPLDTPNVIPAYLAVRNPLEIDADGAGWTNFTNDIAKAQRNGQYDGVIIRNVLDHANIRTALAEGPVDVFVAFAPEQIKSAIGNRGTFDPSRPSILEQTTFGKDKGKRGSVQFGTERQFTINLLENADLSTLLHESGHFYLEVLGDLASKADAPRQIVDDYAELLGWFGVENREGIKVEHHEQFARGFEAYLMTGKAPSVALQNVFSRFRAWLVAIYRDLKRLNVELNPHVRRVFDRLVATDDEITGAQESQNYRPIFATAEEAGVSPEQFAAYRGAVEAARTEAEERLTQHVLADLTREQKAWWKEARGKVLKSVQAEVYANPVYRALTFLQRGTNPDGTAMEGVDHVKLNRKALVDQYGVEYLKRLPRPYVYAKEGGVSPEIIAAMFGFSSGDQMIQGLVNARPMKALIENETDAQMRAAYGDALNDGSLADEAMAAVHGDKRADLLTAELRALKRKMAEVQPFVRASELTRAREQREARAANRGNLPQADERRVIARAAQVAIAGRKVRDINPNLYRVAEAKASRLAFEAAGSGDYETAYLEKRKQLLNHELFRAAIAARERIDTMVDYLKGFDKPKKRAALGKAGANYLEQIDGIRERFDFSRISNIASQKRMALAEWIAEQQAQGFEITLPDSLLSDARRVSYKELTYEELTGIRDVVANIDHLARLKNKLLANRDKADFNATVDDIVGSIDASQKRAPEPIEFAPTLGSKIKKGLKRFAAEHTKMEFLFSWLDGEKHTGPVWQALFKPLADAENAEQVKMRAAREAMRVIFNRYSLTERTRLYSQRVFAQEVGQSFNKASLLAVALNTGNEYNRDVLLKGYGWKQGQLDKLLARLDDRDWETVQMVWDFIDGYWPEIRDLQKDMTGLAPEKVEAVTFVSPTGRTMRGGYYPIKYDSNLSWRQQALDEERSAQELYGGQFVRATTRQGHTKARTDSGGKAVKLNLSVLTEHVTNVIHDLTHRRALLDVDRLVTSKRVREAIEETAGRAMYRQLRPWLRNIGGDYRTPMTAPEAILNHARAGATIVNMGLKITTALVQPLGYLQSLELLGPKYSAIGLRQAYVKGNPLTSIMRAKEFVMERSEQVRNRMTTFDRDVRDQLKTLTETAKSAPVRRGFFFLTGFMDMSVTLPTWLGAYQKAMDGAAEGIPAGDEHAAIDFADSILRRSQSAGGAKDLAGIQAGGAVLKLFTTFYSYFNVLYNLMQRRVQKTDFTSPRDLGLFAASMLTLWFVPAVLSEIVAGRGPDDDEDWDEYLKRTAYLWALYPLQSVVLLRDIANGLGPYGYDGAPALEAMEQTSRSLLIPVKALDPDQELSRADVKAAFLATSYWGHLPGRQMWITGSYMYDWTTGEEDPETVAEAAEGLAFSRKP